MDSSVLQIISEITKNVDAAHVEVLSRNAAAAAADAAEEAPTGELRTTVMKAINNLQTGLLERETEVRLLLLATLCSEHLLLLGPPGTAKSELARRLSGLCGGAYFERLLTRFSVPEELFGPLSMRGLESDVYVRKIDGYLPTAEVAFIDEIFKANSAILNALLTLLNERLFDNGSERLPVPLLCLVGASNELPESEELDALYDRFLIRRQVSQVSNDQIASLARLAAGRFAARAPEASEDEATAEPPHGGEGGTGSGQGEDGAQVASGLLPLEVLQGTLRQAKLQTHVPDAVIDLLTELRNHLQDKCEPPIYVSDRRFMKCVNLLQVAAFADGREEVNEWDCLLLEFAMGNRPDDSRKVAQYVLDTIASDPGLQQSELLFLGLFGRACRILDSAGRGELEELRGEVDTLVEVLDSRHATLCLTLDGGFPELRSTLWQSEASTQQAVQRVTPQMTENRTKLQDLLRESMVLQSCIAGGHSAGVLQKLLPKRFKQYERGISDRT